jgi:hypothetical protein
VCSPPVAQVADKRDVDAVDGHGLADGVQVKEGLGRVLAGPIAGVDDRDRGEFRGKARCSFFRVPDNDCIRVPAHDPDSVGKGFAFCNGTGFDTPYREGGATKARNGGLKREPCPRAGLKEEDGKDLSFECMGIKLFPVNPVCMVKQAVDPFTVKIPD